MYYLAILIVGMILLFFFLYTAKEGYRNFFVPKYPDFITSGHFYHL